MSPAPSVVHWILNANKPFPIICNLFAMCVNGDGCSECIWMVSRKRNGKWVLTVLHMNGHEKGSCLVCARMLCVYDWDRIHKWAFAIGIRGVWLLQGNSSKLRGSNILICWLSICFELIRLGSILQYIQLYIYIYYLYIVEYLCICISTNFSCPIW